MEAARGGGAEEASSGCCKLWGYKYVGTGCGAARGVESPLHLVLHCFADSAESSQQANIMVCGFGGSLQQLARACIAQAAQVRDCLQGHVELAELGWF